MVMAEAGIRNPSQRTRDRRDGGAFTQFKQGLREVSASPNGVVYLSLLAFCIAALSYQFPAQIPMVIAAAGLLYGVILQGRGFRSGGAPGVALLMFFGFVVLSVPLSIYVTGSLRALQEYAKFFLIYLVAVNALTTRRRVIWLYVVLVAMAAMFPARGALQFYLEGNLKEAGRANWWGTYGNSNALALVLLMHLPFAAVLVTLRRSTSWKLVWVGVGVLLAAVAVLTQSRAGFVALSGIAVGFVVLSRKKLAATAVIFAGAISVAVFAPAEFRARMGTIFAAEEERDGSATGRLDTWGVAVDMALSRPLTGIGLGNYAKANDRWAPHELGEQAGARWIDTHNTILNIWAEIGTFGAIAFLSALLLLLRQSWRVLKTANFKDPLVRLLAAGTVSIVTFMLMGLFNTFHGLWFFYVHFAAMLGGLALLDRKTAVSGVGQLGNKRSLRSRRSSARARYEAALTVARGPLPRTAPSSRPTDSRSWRDVPGV